MDSRNEKLAKNLVNYSCEVKPGEKVLVECVGARTFPLAEKLMEEITQAGGQPYYLLHDDHVRHAQMFGCSEEQMELEASLQRARMEAMDCYIGIRGSENVLENSDIPGEKNRIYSKTVMQKVHFEVRVPKTRWVVLRYPSPSFAQSAKMSTRQFEEFFYKACTMDYKRMDKAMDPLAELMDKTDRVRIIGQGTDMTFSIKDIPSVKCAGKLNIPDGEVFTAPVKESINGKSFCNTPTLYEGNYFDGIHLTWKDGKIVDFDCNIGDKNKLRDIFDRDEGARYVGEFAIGVNPYIRREMLDILFDEKIAGSFHFTPGASYDEAPNGNNSQIHWDMVYRQFPENGGGEIYFDDVLIRKDGLFVLDSLKALNPDELIGE